ncbi:hypothetical protein Hsw_3327 [Hymenobacter swuensis DY53]|uniref:Uncharacterized protein n=1 Tax=Hymenobacter swuensis DY53 TaxID=1227739 RepID=W8F4K5_9BACT|nr:hypothetical protein Hsw_3327 [Hymenobacter swuensis DY53]
MPIRSRIIFLLAVLGLIAALTYFVKTAPQTTNPQTRSTFPPESLSQPKAVPGNEKAPT